MKMKISLSSVFIFHPRPFSLSFSDLVCLMMSFSQFSHQELKQFSLRENYDFSVLGALLDLHPSLIFFISIGFNNQCLNIEHPASNFRTSMFEFSKIKIENFNFSHIFS